ncbi:LLM class flavin-dependent oxidoreductase [Nocardiopsis composta]|uniref:Alkanesulfonate monooxygenase SsuD/methylene tetrahydromethanopterin reductase-like flavin-dependent oxidoreductase (Luciferase family) n=1 Tax=Nocardiopsis composta TaxID=157465 RepID=A0A7W8QLX3_9ACTN|nr:LLM class flavin-dependent oxidoreductase [Nocardiopsis composta]MBB5432679.1 alkanesulfonate monooxygenase SsuD/methylene tetrahydromethanopterin reductase-like flavin-dependent oxidoreductase (luciferase family) [Nocardiopsis composta]
MRIGAFLPAAGFPGQDHTQTLEAAVAAARAAEDAGFDSVWFAEHHFMSYGVCPSAITLAAFVLGRTERISVGTAVSVLSTAHPVALAEQAALLDQVSAGRFRLGVGRGQPLVDLEVFGTLDRYEQGHADALDLLLAAVRGGRVRADGPVFGFREVEVVPGPRTLPRPDVLLAATSEASLGLAAERGLPVLLGMHQRPQEQAAALERYAELRERAGGGPVGGHVAASVAHVADTREEARKALLESLPRWLGPGLAGYRRIRGGEGPRRDPDAYAAFLCDAHAVGSPEDCVRRLSEQAAVTGAEELILLVEGVGAADAVRRNIARLGDEVLPGVRAARSRAGG